MYSTLTGTKAGTTKIQNDYSGIQLNQPSPMQLLNSGSGASVNVGMGHLDLNKSFGSSAHRFDANNRNDKRQM